MPTTSGCAVADLLVERRAQRVEEAQVERVDRVSVLARRPPPCRPHRSGRPDRAASRCWRRSAGRASERFTGASFARAPARARQWGLNSRASGPEPVASALRARLAPGDPVERRATRDRRRCRQPACTGFAAQQSVGQRQRQRAVRRQRSRPTPPSARSSSGACRRRKHATQRRELDAIERACRARSS